jgi:hypothetical protein
MGTHPEPRPPTRAKALKAAAIMAVCLGLAGCGSVSGPPQRTAPTSSSTRTSTTTQASSHLRNPAVRRALASFATCLRHNGVKLAPAQAASDRPLLDTTGIDTSSAHFKTSWARCRHHVNLARALGWRGSWGSLVAAGT